MCDIKKSDLVNSGVVLPQSSSSSSSSSLLSSSSSSSSSSMDVEVPEKRICEFGGLSCQVVVVVGVVVGVSGCDVVLDENLWLANSAR